jgi:hypothetical protein
LEEFPFCEICFQDDFKGVKEFEIIVFIMYVLSINKCRFDTRWVLFAAFAGIFHLKFQN